MSTQRIVGVVLLIVGVILVILGVNASDSIGDQMSKFFTGHLTDTTAWYLLGGAAAAIGGVLLILFGGGRSTRP